MKKFASILSVMILSVLLASQGVFAATTDTVDWEVSNSKEATALDENYETNVTLSLPSAEYKNDLDVVFVVDQSFSAKNSGSAEQAADLLETLAGYENVNIKTAVVIMGGYIPVLNGSPHLEELTSSNVGELQGVVKDTSWRSADGAKGSNIDGAMKYAVNLLDNDTAVSDSNKYVILLSDGGTFAWGDADNLTAKLFNTNANGPAYYWWNQSDFDAKYGDSYPDGRFVSLYNMSNSVIDDSTMSFKVTTEESDAAYGVMPSNVSGSGARTQFTGAIAADTLQTVLGDDMSLSDITIVEKGNDQDYVTSREAAMYHAAHTIIDANDKYTVLYVTSPYYPTSDNLFSATEQFKDFLEDSGVELYRTEGGSAKYPTDYSNEIVDYTKLCDSIDQSLAYVVGSGSVVTDVIGADFDLKNIETIDVKENGESLSKSVSGNTVTFSDASGNEAYTVEYKDESGTESLVWTIKKDITINNVASMTYTLTLANTETAAGTYGQLDLDGDGAIDGTEIAVDSSKAIYTNASAELQPVDSNGNSNYSVVAFPKPSVTYEVKATNDPAKDDENNDTDTDTDSNNSSTSNSKTVKTGDTVNPAIWIALVAAAASALSIIFISRKRRQ